MIQTMTASTFARSFLRSLKVVSVGILALGSLSASASEQTGTPVYDQSSQGQFAPVAALIRGEVKFERRFDRRVEGCQSVNHCRPSQTYWTIVIQTPEERYLLNQRYNEGNSELPDSLTLNGAVLRPGSIVQIAGNILPIAPSFHLLMNVESLQLLMD